jgi:hypothetical protein
MDFLVSLSKRKKFVLDKHTIVNIDGTRKVYNWFQYYSPEELEKEFEARGLKVEALYADVAGSPFHPETNEFAIIEKKTQKG